MKTLNSKAGLVLAAFMLSAAMSPIMAQDPVANGSAVKQETQFKEQNGTMKVERERDSSGVVTTNVDHDWSAGTWLAIGLGVLLVAGIGYAITRRNEFDSPIGSVR